MAAPTKLPSSPRIPKLPTTRYLNFSPAVRGGTEAALGSWPGCRAAGAEDCFESCAVPVCELDSPELVCARSATPERIKSMPARKGRQAAFRERESIVFCLKFFLGPHRYHPSLT